MHKTLIEILNDQPSSTIIENTQLPIQRTSESGYLVSINLNLRTGRMFVTYLTGPDAEKTFPTDKFHTLEGRLELRDMPLSR